jgi:hypothetical protein
MFQSAFCPERLPQQHHSRMDLPDNRRKPDDEPLYKVHVFDCYDYARLHRALGYHVPRQVFEEATRFTNLGAGDTRWCLPELAAQ